MEKLVRDRIPEIIRAEGRDCDIRIADDSEYHGFLLRKLDEEVAEFKEDENVEELADVMEVLMALAKDLGYSFDELLGANRKKREERGAFNKHIILRS